MKIFLFQKIIIFYIFSFFTVFSGTSDFENSVEVKTIFGPISLESVLLRIYKLNEMQRLKNIDRLGSLPYWSGIKKFNRLDHCLNVLWLVKNFGGDIQEQIAALTHDISYTVFPEAADIVFGKPNYQDTLHEWFLQQTSIRDAIAGHDFVEKDILPENLIFKRLNPQPTKENSAASPASKKPKIESLEMSADSIANVLQTGLLLKMITQKDIDLIRDNLRFENDQWFFINAKAAKRFGFLSLVLTQHFWGLAKNLVVYRITGLIFKRALDLQRITKEDMNFGTDKQILDKLDACDDPQLKKLIAKAKIPKNAFKPIGDGQGSPDFCPKPKFLGLDPLVHFKHSKKFKRLSKIDKKFAKQFKLAQQFCEKGYKLQLNLK